MRERSPEDYLGVEWKEAFEDPVREYLLACGKQPDLDEILGMFPRTTGDAAFDSEVIASNIARLRTTPEVDTGHPFLDLSVKTGLAFIDATFQGDHPKYGVKHYARGVVDTFPPIIIATVDALTAWGINARAVQLFRYWLLNMVREDGTTRYNDSISSYGQLFHTAALLEERAGVEGWWSDCFETLDRMADYLLRLRAEAEKVDGLIVGSPESGKSEEDGKYFHNNLWAAKGLLRWAEISERQNASPSTSINTIRGIAKRLVEDTLAAINDTWPADPADWWLPPQTEPLERPQRVTGTLRASYTNYRYWPELLSSGLLPKDMANRVVEARLQGGGQFCGMTRFEDRLDDWPMADYLYGVWSLGRKDDFFLSLYGHVAYHQAEGHLTAYEQMTFPPGKERASYCLPCQLVAARAARLLVE